MEVGNYVGLFLHGVSQQQGKLSVLFCLCGAQGYIGEGVDGKVGGMGKWVLASYCMAVSHAHCRFLLPVSPGSDLAPGINVPAELHVAYSVMPLQ